MFYLVLTSLIWAFSFGLIKSELSAMNPVAVSAIRLFLSLIIFLPFLKPQGKRVNTRLMTIGAIQFGLMYCLYIASFRYLKAYEVALLTVTTPLLVVLIDGWRRKKVKTAYWVAAILAVAGSLVLVWGSRDWAVSLKGLLLIQLANFCFAWGQLLYKKLKPKGGEKHHFGWLYLGGCLVPLLLLAVPRDLIAIGSGDLTPQNAEQWWALLYLGILPSGLGFFLWNIGAARVNNGILAVMNNIKLPLAALMAWLVFGENPEFQNLVLSGVFFAMAFFVLRKSSA